jgi:hypothetical protein
MPFVFTLPVKLNLYISPFQPVVLKLYQFKCRMSSHLTTFFKKFF